MAEKDSPRNGRSTEKGFAGARDRQTVPFVFRKSPPVGDSCDGQEQEAGWGGGKAGRLNWRMVLLWAFVAVSFAALAVAGYLVWVKCFEPPPI